MFKGRISSILFIACFQFLKRHLHFQYVKTIIDTELMKNAISSKIVNHLDTLPVRYDIRPQIKSNTVYWQRLAQQTFSTNDNGVRAIRQFDLVLVLNTLCVCFFFQIQLTDKWHDENLLLVILTGRELNDLVKNDELLNHLESTKIMFENKEITLLIIGLKEYCRQNAGNVGRQAFETALTEVQLLANISHRLLDTADDLGNTIMQFSKSVAEIPYK